MSEWDEEQEAVRNVIIKDDLKCSVCNIHLMDTQGMFMLQIIYKNYKNIFSHAVCVDCLRKTEAITKSTGATQQFQKFMEDTNNESRKLG